MLKNVGYYKKLPHNLKTRTQKLSFRTATNYKANHNAKGECFPPRKQANAREKLWHKPIPQNLYQVWPQ